MGPDVHGVLTSLYVPDTSDANKDRAADARSTLREGVWCRPPICVVQQWVGGEELGGSGRVHRESASHLSVLTWCVSGTQRPIARMTEPLKPMTSSSSGNTF